MSSSFSVSALKMIWGRTGFDGGVESGIAGRSEDAALKASTV